MDIEQALLQEHSKANTLVIRAAILDKPESFDALWQLIITGEPPLPQRGAWVLSHIGETHPEMFQPYFSEILDLLKADKHDAVHRALIRTLAQMDFPEEYEGELYDLAISWIASPAKAVAIRVFCMEVAARIAMPYPELREELCQVIEAHMSWGSAGYQSRGKRIIKSLRKA